MFVNPSHKKIDILFLIFRENFSAFLYKIKKTGRDGKKCLTLISICVRIIGGVKDGTPFSYVF